MEEIFWVVAISILCASNAHGQEITKPIQEGGIVYAENQFSLQYHLAANGEYTTIEVPENVTKVCFPDQVTFMESVSVAGREITRYPSSNKDAQGRTWVHLDAGQKYLTFKCFTCQELQSYRMEIVFFEARCAR